MESHSRFLKRRNWRIFRFFETDLKFFFPLLEIILRKDKLYRYHLRPNSARCQSFVRWFRPRAEFQSDSFPLDLFRISYFCRDRPSSASVYSSVASATQISNAMEGEAENECLLDFYRAELHFRFSHSSVGVSIYFLLHFFTICSNSSIWWVVSTTDEVHRISKQVG